MATLERILCAITTMSLAMGDARYACADEPAARIPPAVRGYGAPEGKITPVKGDAAVVLGARAALFARRDAVERDLTFGVALYGLSTAIAAPAALAQGTGESRIGFAYGGARFGYVFWPDEPVHPAASILVGGGGVTVVSKNDASSFQHDGGAIAVVEPQVELEIVMNPFVRVALGGTYRYVNGLDRSGLGSSDLSGPSASIAIQIGAF